MINMADMKSREVESRSVEKESITKDYKHLHGHKSVKIGMDKAKPGDLTLAITADVEDTLKGLKAVQREARNTTKALRELESQQRKNKHLVIEVDQLGDVPKVYYKGRKVLMKEKINFEWDTANDKYPVSRTKIGIDYYERSEDAPYRKGIHEVKGPREQDR